jgi:hypothetical protein
MNIKRQITQDIKEKHCCAICGEQKLRMSFHHVYPETKVNHVAHLALANSSVSDFLDEIDKCVLVCGSCHGKLHGPMGLIIDKDKLLAKRIDTSPYRVFQVFWPKRQWKYNIKSRKPNPQSISGFPYWEHLTPEQIRMFIYP